MDDGSVEKRPSAALRCNPRQSPGLNRGALCVGRVIGSSAYERIRLCRHFLAALTASSIQARSPILYALHLDIFEQPAQNQVFQQAP